MFLSNRFPKKHFARFSAAASTGEKPPKQVLPDDQSRRPSRLGNSCIDYLQKYLSLAHPL